MDSEEDMADDVPVESTPSNLPLSARSVLQTIASIRKNPSLRQGFVSGNRAVLETAMSEVRSTFQPKRGGRPAKVRGTPQGSRKTKEILL